MKITLLGCGTSSGVPLIGNLWGNCDPSNPKNRRRRASILVEDDDLTLLVDTSPDLREQLLGIDIKSLENLSAVLYTHAHGDHTNGIDDLRAMNWILGKPIPIYADPDCLAKLKNNFSFAFIDEGQIPQKFSTTTLVGHEIDVSKELKFGTISVKTFWQDHGRSKSLGYRFNDFAYSSDVKNLDDDAFTALSGVKIWVVDCVREHEHNTHAHLEQTLKWINRLKPEKAYLTHMDHSLDYETLAAKLPPNVFPAYDGMVIAL